MYELFPLYISFEYSLSVGKKFQNTFENPIVLLCNLFMLNMKKIKNYSL